MKNFWCKHSGLEEDRDRIAWRKTRYTWTERALVFIARGRNANFLNQPKKIDQLNYLQNIIFRYDIISINYEIN